MMTCLTQLPLENCYSSYHLCAHFALLSDMHSQCLVFLTAVDVAVESH